MSYVTRSRKITTNHIGSVYCGFRKCYSIIADVPIPTMKDTYNTIRNYRFFQINKIICCFTTPFSNMNTPYASSNHNAAEIYIVLMCIVQTYSCCYSSLNIAENLNLRRIFFIEGNFIFERTYRCFFIRIIYDIPTENAFCNLDFLIPPTRDYDV